DWSPDGRFLAVVDKSSPNEPFAIFMVSLADGKKSRLTSPPARTIGDSNPAFSPDGKTVSFIRAPSSGVGDVYAIPAAGGEPQRVTFDNRYILSQAWAPISNVIVFSSGRTGGQNLWWVPTTSGLGKTTPKRLAGIGENASEANFSRDGRHLVYSQFFEDANIWRVLLGSNRSVRVQDKVISSTQYDSSPQFSPDGRKVTFRSNRAGNHEIWISDRDGGNAFQLTNFGGPLTGTPRWSPDGRWVAFDSRPEGQPDIYKIAAEGGPPQRMTDEPSEDVVPSWSRDGTWIYFASNRSGSLQVWKVPAEGGSKVQVTHGGGFAAFESADRKFLYYSKGRSVSGLWRLPLAGGPEEPVLSDLKPGFWGYWEVVRDGIYFVDQTAPGGSAEICFFDLATHRRSRITAIAATPAIADSAFA